MLDDKGAAKDEGAKPDGRPVIERFPTVNEIVEKLGIPVEAAHALVEASLRDSRLPSNRT
jgi:hypothetical protein